MSNTAVSRRMEDMRNAGINPILAGKYDASTPAGSMPNFHDPAATAVQGFSAATTAKKTEQEIKNLSTQELGYRIDNKIKDSTQKVMANVGELAIEINDIIKKYREMKNDVNPHAVNLGAELKQAVDELQAGAENTGRKAHDLVQKIKTKWSDFWNAIKTRENFKQYLGVE